MQHTALAPSRRPTRPAAFVLPPATRDQMAMAVALVMEVVREPRFDHVLAVLRRSDERDLLLLRCRNPEIIAFWRGRAE